MTQLHYVKKSRKEQKDTVTGETIPVGSSYYWWQFAFSPKNISKERPKPQRLTRSDYEITVMDIQDAIDGLTIDNLEDEVSIIVSNIDDLKEECEEKLSNMPEQLQDGDVGQLLQERIDTLEDWSSNIQGVDISVDDDEEDVEQRLQDIIGELQGP